jgi:hypothetical protein
MRTDRSGRRRRLAATIERWRVETDDAQARTPSDDCAPALGAKTDFVGVAGTRELSRLGRSTHGLKTLVRLRIKVAD